MLDPKALSDMAQRYNKYKEFIKNEEETKASLVVPLLKLLGYDTHNPCEVRREWQGAFVTGDGKKSPDRMDLAIFDESGEHPRFVIEVKSLGVDLNAKAPQLARYIAQVTNLHFGMMTDGCHWQFYGDLENPNQMDAAPFFSFGFDDPNTDWTKVARELNRFNRDSFNAETLVTDAENAKYRQAMIDKLSSVLRAPGEDEGFLRWLSDGVYKGVKTTKVLARLSGIAKEAIEPALFKVMSNEFIERLRNRLQEETKEPQPPVSETMPEPEVVTARKGVVTTEDELALYEKVKEICGHGGFSEADILWRDTTNYFNISYKRPRSWFLRYFGDSRKKNIATMVPVEEAIALCPGFTVEPCPAVFGVSRVFIESIDQVAGLGALVLKALQMAEGTPPEA